VWRTDCDHEWSAFGVVARGGEHVDVDEAVVVAEQVVDEARVAAAAAPYELMLAVAALLLVKPPVVFLLKDLELAQEADALVAERGQQRQR
jgi:hypothetical protein